MLQPWILKSLSQVPSLYPGEAIKGDTKWINGLRGICACCVISHHLFMALRGDIIYPGSPHARVHGMWHWPFFHAFTEGYQWVLMFLILASWVNSLKPLQAMNRGQVEVALSMLNRGALRRPLRLMIPAGLITVISCVMAQLDLFHFGGHATNWITQGSPAPSHSIWIAARKLWESLWATWFDSGNYFERNQWTMKWFLEGSWKLFAILLPLAALNPTWRRIVVIVQCIWAWKTHEAFVNIPTYSGLLFAEISTASCIQNYAFSDNISHRILSPSLFIFGWYMISYPGVDEEWAPWFQWIWERKESIYGGGDTYRLTCCVGAWCILSSILISPTMQSILNSPMTQWLGKHSFAIYLIHGVTLRSVFTFFAYGLFTNEDHPDPLGFRLFLSLMIFFITTFYLSHLWTIHVEPWCLRVTDAIEELVCSTFDVKNLVQSIFSFHGPETQSMAANKGKISLPNLTEVTVESASRNRFD